MSHNWKNTLIQVDCTIRDALTVIDKEALRGAIVVDCDNKLLGLVSDGDIRRGILSGISLDESVDNVMNSHPTIASSEASKEQLIELMESKEILSIPIVENGIVVGLQTLYESLSTPKVENPVFLMAGGFGTRLRPLTNNCPKPLLKVGDKPILEITLLNFIKSGFVNFYISTHYLPEMIQDHFGDGSKWGINITYVHENSPLGTGGALGLLPSDLPALPLIMMNGDVLTKINFEQLLSYHNKLHPLCTMCVREDQYTVPYGVVEADGTRITSLIEKPTHKYFINAGVYIVSKTMVNAVTKNQHVDMTDLIEQYLQKQQYIAMFPVHEYWLDIGKMVDFYQAQKDVSHGGNYAK